MKRTLWITAIAAMILLWLAVPSWAVTEEVKGKCMTCHKEKSAGLYYQWRESEHALHNVTCYDCHGAERSDVDSYEHHGAWIATLVTPKDCGECHERESEEFQASYHAKAGEILQSADAYQAHVVGGAPVAVAGCKSCHGSNIKIDKNSPNKLEVGSWPNSGVGRINPDGSLGSCNACHVRHQFDPAQARRPENCGKCHLGPDHPQKEVYEESKHGVNYNAHMDKMNLDADPWVVGQDYFAAPTCATCHMSATPSQEVTHDVGKRLSWTTRPPVSAHKEDWQRKRKNMQDVCSSCHSKTFFEGHYAQMDGVINLYDQKFGIPATEIMNIVRENGTMENAASFSNDLEWIYWELWHHEGRRARHGAQMMGPDYAWWHGIYEVGKHFYFDFIPEVRKVGDEEAIAYIDSLLANDPMHSWLNKDTATLKKAIQSGELQEMYQHMYQPIIDKNK